MNSAAALFLASAASTNNRPQVAKINLGQTQRLIVGNETARMKQRLLSSARDRSSWRSCWVLGLEMESVGGVVRGVIQGRRYGGGAVDAAVSSVVILPPACRRHGSCRQVAGAGAVWYETLLRLLHLLM
jgi:hypothetical protein